MLLKRFQFNGKQLGQETGEETVGEHSSLILHYITILKLQLNVILPI